MNAIELLEKQHRTVEGIFSKLEHARSASAALALELANHLAAHMAIEQEIFYPAIQEVDPDMIQESLEEHALAELAIKRLLMTDPGDEAYKARVVAAKELIEHHVEEEEEDLFEKVKKAMAPEQLEQLGIVMKRRYLQVLAAGYGEVVPPRFSTTSADVSRRQLHRGKRKVA